MSIGKGKHTSAQRKPRWAVVSPAEAGECNRYLMADGAVRWLAEGETFPFVGVFAMAGYRSRFTLYYMVDEDGSYDVCKHCGYPFLGGMGYAYRYDVSPRLYVEGTLAEERVVSVETRGRLDIVAQSDGCEIRHSYYPAVQSMGLIERITVVNRTASTLDLRLDLPQCGFVARKGLAVPVASGMNLADEKGRMLTDLDENAYRTLAPHDEAAYYVVYWSKVRAEDLMVDCRLEWKKREEQIADAFCNTLVLHTPEPLLNRAFAHALLAGFEHLADSPIGVALWEDGVWVERTAGIVPILGYCGVHRAKAALAHFFAAAGDRSYAYFDVEGKPSGSTDGIVYGRALAHRALTAGNEQTLKHDYAVLRGLVDSIRKQCKNAIYTRKPTLSVQCDLYELLVLSSRVAACVEEPEQSKVWQEAAAAVRSRIETQYGAEVCGYHTYRTNGKTLCAEVAKPLCVGVDERAEGTAKALVSEMLFDGWAHVRHDAKHNDYREEDTFAAILGLAKAGYADAAGAMAKVYATQVLYGLCSPYPMDEWSKNGAQSALSSWRFCQTLLGALLSVEPLSTDRVGLCLHLPREWRHCEVRGLAIGGSVLNLEWKEGNFKIEDIFGQILYDGLALCGQHVEVELPH